MQYPLTIKPVQGAGSVSAPIAKNQPELEVRAQVLLEAGKGPVLLENYESGSEVNINIILANGTLLYYGIK